MKIFISHSTRDRWVARRLSEDLEALDMETFLDAKDILTGDSIDSTIQDNLRTADEILMLLSPAALESDWVMIEIGGAKALGKLLIPIMLHVGPNELPQALRAGLARDINDVDRYYSEVRERASSPVTEPPPATRSIGSAPMLQRTFSLGDVVKIAASRQETFTAPTGVPVSWEDPMTAHAGKTATVVEVDNDRTVKLDVDEGEWWWAMDWLEPA